MHKRNDIKVTKKSFNLQIENKNICFTLDRALFVLSLHKIKTLITNDT